MLPCLLAAWLFLLLRLMLLLLLPLLLLLQLLLQLINLSPQPLHASSRRGV
jgi:hypothetical protein